MIRDFVQMFLMFFSFSFCQTLDFQLLHSRETLSSFLLFFFACSGVQFKYSSMNEACNNSSDHFMF